MSLAIEIQNLAFSWDKQAPCLVIPEFKVKAGESVFLQGASGSGKTTLLNLISGMTQAQQGEVMLFDQNLKHLSASQRDQFRAKNLGIIFQQFNLLPYLSVQDNLLIAAKFARQTLSQKQIEELMQRLTLPLTILQKKTHQLSIGQQQRIAVMRAFVIQPKLIIADEPTSALDADNKQRFMDELFALADKNETSILFVSHDKSLANHFDRMVDLQQLNQAVLP